MKSRTTEPKYTMSAPYPNDELFAVCAPDGHIIHTTASADPASAIKEYVETEQSMQWVINLSREMHGESKSCAPSWEGLEAQGFRVITVSLVPRDEVLNEE